MANRQGGEQVDHPWARTDLFFGLARLGGRLGCSTCCLSCLRLLCRLELSQLHLPVGKILPFTLGILLQLHLRRHTESCKGTCKDPYGLRHVPSSTHVPWLRGACTCPGSRHLAEQLPSSHVRSPESVRVCPVLFRHSRCRLEKPTNLNMFEDAGVGCVSMSTWNADASAACKMPQSVPQA